MCGIAGWVSYEGDLRAQRDVIAYHDENYGASAVQTRAVLAFARHVGLGHRRLTIIDLAGGAQPMQAEEEGRTIASLIYTGEVYKLVELRDELKRPRPSTSRPGSDTEVVLRGYLQWGDKVVERLNGMFAFAIWDVVTEELFLARDRMGVKPLFYYPTADGVLFGSEPEEAILSHPSVRAAREQGRLSRTTRAREEPRSHDLCRHVRGAAWRGRARKSHRNNETQLLETYCARNIEDDLPRTIRTVLELLEDIVQRQIVADVPLCSLLSGGLNTSASVTALAHRAIFIHARGGGYALFPSAFRRSRRNLVRRLFPQVVRRPVRTGIRGPRRLRSHRSRAGQPGPRRPGSEPRRHPGKRLSAQSFRRHVLLAVPAVPGRPDQIDRGAVR